ncbi:hypothetical protein DSAG12_00555 [Promethearchaeum syntrophicum]|uniref:Uncharacterized protein n=1 Tax=Promethearchaeum syntrophicum TaxID=2594042 RepID=A0A5B9D7B2_9ARCH|nr:hypothetical protein [Candidatus Prometheoarchaeum syntrophicum]QEE14740.1 hypothetical protein DSAG12_00555 [Candidatus Prometheoarchaeum syntrophicum]
MLEKLAFFLDIFNKFKSISIIGTAKNVGKTTTLNYMINIAKNKYNLGLTSIGRDGESKDAIFSTPKPRIYVEKGTIIATAKQCISNTDITKEILVATDFKTPLGEILIIRALSDGFVELAGPSKNSELLEIKNILFSFNCDFVIIDGAVNRKSYASPIVTDATILATGAAFSPDIDRVVHHTSHLVNLLSLEGEKNSQIINLSKKIIQNGTIGFISPNHETKIINNFNAREALKNVKKELLNDYQIIVVKGIVSDNFIEEFMNYVKNYNRMVLLVEDSTKLFLSREVLSRFQKSGGILKVIYPIKIVGVTINPKSPIGDGFSKDKFLKLLKQNIQISVFNLLEDS